MADTPYSPYYAQNLEQSSAPVSSGGQFVQENVDRKEAIKRQIGSAAEKYANQTGVGISDARALMQARYDNMIASEKAKVTLETKDLKAQSSLSQAQIELAGINPRDEKAAERHQEILNKYATPLAGTSYWKDFSSQVKGLQKEALGFTQEERRLKQEDIRAKQATPEYQEQLEMARTKGRLREVGAEKQLEQWQKEQDPMYQAKLRNEQIKTRLQNRQAAMMLESQKKDLLARYGVTEPDLQTGFEANEKGSQVGAGKGTHIAFKTYQNKRPVKRVISKDEFSQIRDRLSDLNDQIDSLKYEAGEPQSPSQTSTPSGTMVYDPATGTLKPKE